MVKVKPREARAHYILERREYNTECPLPVEEIVIDHCGADGKELTQLLSHFPKLTKLVVISCEKITELGVVELQTEMTTPSSSFNEIETEHAQAGRHQTRGEEVEDAAGGGGLLLLPRQLQELSIYECKELRLLSNSMDKDNDNPRGGGIQSLCSLQSLHIAGCPRFLSSYSSSASSCSPFPTSLQQLDLSGVKGMETLAPLSNLISLTSLTMYHCGDLRGVEGMETLAPLSNLISLTTLVVRYCGDLRGEGLWRLVAQGRLKELRISGTPKFFTGSEPSRPHDQEIPSSSSKLELLSTDDLAGVLTAPICRLLSSALTILSLYDNNNKEVERFTEEQEEALHLLNSLQELEFFNYRKLQRLPAGLTKLASLKKLRIWICPAIQLLPKDGLPSSLQKLHISDCPAIKSLPKDVLPSSLQELDIINCSAIKSLPKDGLPSSLRKLLCGGISEELKRQGRKLKGTIPIIIDY